MAKDSADSFVKRAYVACFAGLSAAVVFLVFLYAADVLLLVFAGALLSVLLHGLAVRVSPLLHLSYRKAYGVTLVGLLGLVALTGWFTTDRLAGEIDQLSERLPRAANELMDRLKSHNLARRVIDEVPSPERLIREPRDFVQRATGVVSKTASAVTSAFVILFIGLYLGFDPGLYKRGFLSLYSPAHRERADTVLDKVGQTLWWWLLAHMSSMAVVGVLTTIGLFALGIPLAIVLGLIAAALAFIPNIGPVISAAPAILIALSESPTKALYVIFLYVAVQAVETNLITPVFELKAVSLPPALTISVQLLLGSLVGILGLLMASPVCAMSIVLVQALYINRDGPGQ